MALVPGVELDILIGERVFGRKRVVLSSPITFPELGSVSWFWDAGGRFNEAQRTPPWSTDSDAALGILGAFPQATVVLRRLGGQVGFECRISQGARVGLQSHATLAGAVALAALDFLGVSLA